MKIRRSPLTIRDLTFKFENKKIKNCLSFQRQACWPLKSEVSYVSGIAAGRYPGVLLTADVNKCSENDYYSDFWKELVAEGYELLSIDGNNRTTTLARFVKDSFRINFNGSKVFFSEMHQDDQKAFLDLEVEIVVHEDVTRADCTDIFLEHNEGKPLKPQERRNAMLYAISPLHRELELKVRKKMVDINLFKEENKERKNDEFLLAILCYLEDHTLMTKKSRLNEVWDQNEVKCISDYGKLKSFVLNTIPEFLSYKTLAQTSATISVRDLAIMYGYLNANDIKVSRSTSKTFIGGLARRLDALMKTTADECPIKLNDGSTVPYSTLTSHHMNGTYFPARVKALIEHVLLPSLEEDARESKSAERSTLAGQPDTRYELWKQQNFICIETKKVISDPLSSDWEVDHIIPLEEGGADEMDNFQLVCRDFNRSKGASIVYTLEMA